MVGGCVGGVHSRTVCYFTLQRAGTLGQTDALSLFLESAEGAFLSNESLAALMDP